jgi:hypothetical protein
MVYKQMALLQIKTGDVPVKNDDSPKRPIEYHKGEALDS